MKIDIRSGMAFHNGFEIMTRRFHLQARLKKDRVKLRYRARPDLGPDTSNFRSIPVLGSILQSLAFLRTNPILIPLIMMGLTPPATTKHVDPSHPIHLTWVGYTVIIIFAAGFSYLIFGLAKDALIAVFSRFSIFRWHSIEHKCINCLESDKLSLQDIHGMTSFNIHCGSFLATLWIPLLLLTDQFLPGLSNTWQTLLAKYLAVFAIGFEIRRMVKLYHIEPVFRIAQILQRLFCWKPNENQELIGLFVEMAVVGLENDLIPSAQEWYSIDCSLAEVRQIIDEYSVEYDGILKELTPTFA